MTWDDDPEFEEIDAMSPPDYSSESTPEEPDGDDWVPPAPVGAVGPESGASPDEDDDAWGPEKGFPDPSGAVRVWGSSDGTLEKVRISLSWRERLRGRALGEAVTVAFMFMNNYLHVYEPPGIPAAEPYRGPELTREQRVEVSAQIAGIDAQLAKLDPQEFPGVRLNWEPAVGSDFEDGVRVQLDETGRPAIARFDPKWLQTANSRELALGIMSSYRRARALYQPPATELDPRGQLLAARNRLVAKLALRPQPDAPETGPVTAGLQQRATAARMRRTPQRVGPSISDTGSEDWREQ